MPRALRACADAIAYFTVLPVGRIASGGAPDAYALSFCRWSAQSWAR